MMVEAQGVLQRAQEAGYCVRETKAVEAIPIVQKVELKQLDIEDTKVVGEVELANQLEAQVSWDYNCIRNKVIQVRQILLKYRVVPSDDLLSVSIDRS